MSLVTGRIPDTYPLDPEDQEKLEGWLKDKKCRCPACRKALSGQGNGGRLVFHGGVYGNSHEERYHAVMLTCKNCGHLSFFCPFVMGILQAPSAQE
jgi:hypothetical protein